MSNLDLTIVEIMHGDTEVLKIMKGDIEKWPCLPYDAEVEYLQSDGTAYIDTGIIPTLNTKVITKVAFMQTTPYGYFGSRNSDLRFTCTTFSGGGYFAFSMNYNAWPTSRGAVVLDTPFVLMAKNGQYSINNNTYSSTLVSNKNFTESFQLFRYNNSSNYEYSRMKLYYIQFYENDELKHDFVAVRKNGVGYLYDKVSGVLFGNDAASGAFTYGNDV